jgi:hypothetical protein
MLRTYQEIKEPKPKQIAGAAVALSASCVAFTFIYLVIATWVRNKLLNDSDTFGISALEIGSCSTNSFQP